MGILDVIKAGGWPMYPIMVLGIWLIAATVRQIRRPEAKRQALVDNLKRTTMTIGYLGTTLGMIHCLMNLGSLPPNAVMLDFALQGLGESLNCIGCSLVMLGFSNVIATVGAARAASAE